MSKKRYFDTKFWSDTFVVEELNPLDRYLFMYLMLNEKTNIAGVYELPIRTMAYELGLDREEVVRMLGRLEPKVYYRDGWVVLTNGIRHQNYHNMKIKEGIRRELCNAPSSLMGLCRLPSDLDIDLTCNIDDPYMSHQDPSTLNRIESNLIESNKDLIESKSNPDAEAAVATKRKRPDPIPKEILDEAHSYWFEKLDYALEGAGNRTACAALVRKYGIAKLKQLIDGVAKAQSDRYAPRIGDFRALKFKDSDLIAWGRQDNYQTVKGKVTKIS